MLSDLWNATLKGVNDLAGTVSEGAKEKTLTLIEDWLKIFPQLAEYGLEITSFSMGLALSPSLNVDLLGAHKNWSDEAIAQRLAEHKGETAITIVLSTIRTAYRRQRQTRAPRKDPLILKITVKITPEVRVVLGFPFVEE